MRARVLVWSRRAAIGVAGLTVGLVLCIVAVLTVPAVARLAVNAGIARAPIPVAVTEVRGALRGPLILEGVEVERDGARVSIERVVLDWRPLGLVSRSVVVDSLHVTGVSAFVPEGFPPAAETDEASPDTASSPPTVPELPVWVDLRQLLVLVDRVVVEGRGGVQTARLEASGSLEDFTLDLRMEAAGAPVEQMTLDLSVAGAPDAYRLSARTDFVSSELPAVRGLVEANGSLTGARVDSARVDTENGHATLRGEVAWYPEIIWDVQAAADLLDIAPLTPDPEAWPGRVTFRGSTEGRLAESGVIASVRVDDLDGSLRGEALSGQLAAEVRFPAVSLETLDLRWGDVEVRGSGEVVDTADLDLAVHIPNLGQVLPGATGRIDVEGSVYGEPTRPRVVADFDVADVRVDSLSLRSARGAVDVDLRAPDAPARLTARMDGLISGSTVVDSVVVAVDGSSQRHDVRAGAWLEPAGVTLLAAGALTLPSGDGTVGPAWAGSIDSLTVATEVAGAWTLTEPAKLLASADSVTLSRACLRQGPTGACAAVDRDASGALLASIDVEALPLSLLPAELPEGTTLSGRADATARVDLAADGELRATAEATVNGTATALAGEDTVRFDFGGDGFDLVVDSLGARTTADFLLQPMPVGAPFTVSASGTLPGLTSIDVDPESQSLQGEARVESEDLSFLTAFVTGIGEFEGRLRLDASAGGTLAAPELRGGVEFTDGRVTVPDAGLDLHAIRMAGQADTEGGIALEGGARSGDGEVRIEGRTPVEPSEADPARVRITGERFRAVATSEVQVEIAPDMEVVFDGALIRVEGEVAVPWARVELVEVPPAAVAPSSDVIIIDDEPVAPPEVDARVRVVVGDDVRFSGLGFTSLIEGDLTVRETPGTPPSVLGELRFIDGRYRAYGQDLEIDPGRIIFAGPVEDAGLDVTAIRTAQDGTEAGLEVRGSATAPEITLTSDPAMADADVLSYILYGQPLSDGNASQQGQVAGAAATLGANVLTTRLASEVGLDDARIEGTTQDQAQLVAGKYITPSVYVSYGVGLFRPSNTFRIKYLLNSNWALQAESGDANGGDVLYQIERGR